MNGNLFAIVVTHPGEYQHAALLHGLGYKNLNKAVDLPFETARYPGEEKIYIGEYNNRLIICSTALALEFLGRTTSNTEEWFKKRFPKSAFAAFVIQQTIGLWGYCCWEKGNKIRVRAGSSKEGIIVDAGNPVTEEETLLARAFEDAAGNRLFTGKKINAAPVTEQAMGEQFVSEVWARYFGKTLPEMEQAFNEVEMEGYGYEVFTKADLRAARRDVRKRTGKKWWQFWK